LKRYFLSLLLCAASFSNAASVKDKALTEMYTQKLTEKGAFACLSSLLYNEARGESLAAQKAVAHVALFRSVKLNKSLCSIIMQKGQYSWYKKGYKFGKLTGMEDVVLDLFVDMVQNKHITKAFYHHDTSIDKPWQNVKFVRQIGRIKFYSN